MGVVGQYNGGGHNGENTTLNNPFSMMEPPLLSTSEEN
jgi:hypothetical protein